MINTFVIKRPIITEKTLALAAKENTFVFLVDRNAEKNQIKNLVETLFKVKVVSVNTVLGHNKTRKTGRKRLRTQQVRTKKALVKLVEGQKIDLFDLEGAQA